MYLKKYFVKNQGPISEIRLEMKFKENNFPIPYVIVGRNGSGKSIFLSNIVDAFYEIASLRYHNVKKIDEFGREEYFKIISSEQIKINEDYAIAIADFTQDEDDARYLFKVGNVEFEKFQKDNNIILEDKFKWSGVNFKKVIFEKENIKKAFEDNIICYFSPMRYNKPFWEIDSYYNQNITREIAETKIDGKLKNTIHAKIDYNIILQWIFDVIADSRADLRKKEGEQGYEILYPNTHIIDILSITRHNLENIMSEILGKKVIFRMSNRSAAGRRFSILDQDYNVLIHSLDALSTGQLALFELFATIIMYADNDDIDLSYRLDEIQGIVVIDEIDLHLHPLLQTEVLPKLIRLFPKIQFIFTTHSPLLVLGMEKEFGKDGVVIYELPYGNEIGAEEFTEFNGAYKYYANTDKYINEIRAEISKNNTNLPLIITEGTTDWMHIEKAFIELSKQEIYKELFDDLNCDFLRYSNEINMGNQVISNMCENFSKIPLNRKLIFIADRDDKSINKKLMDPNKLYKKWSKEVYSFILPIPKHRVSTPDISIEHLYSDNVIKTEFDTFSDRVSRRLYMGCEFDNRGISLDGKKICEKHSACGLNKINIIDGSSGSRVTLIEDPNTNIAISKMDFAQKIKENAIKNIDFTSFIPIFKTIKKIIKEN